MKRFTKKNIIHVCDTNVKKQDFLMVLVEDPESGKIAQGKLFWDDANNEEVCVSDDAEWKSYEDYKDILGDQ